MRWLPGGSSKLSGEVKNGIIIVYEENEDVAVETLKHEVLDYFLTSRVITPLTDLVNVLVRDRAERVYGEKERLIEGFVKLMDSGGQS